MPIYYRRDIEPSGEIPPLIFHGPISEVEEEARHIDWLGRDTKRGQTFSGTVIVDARFLGPIWQQASVRNLSEIFAEKPDWVTENDCYDDRWRSTLLRSSYTSNSEKFT